MKENFSNLDPPRLRTGYSTSQMKKMLIERKEEATQISKNFNHFILSTKIQPNSVLQQSRRKKFVSGGKVNLIPNITDNAMPIKNVFKNRLARS